VQHKKFLLIAITTAATLAITISTIVSSKSHPAGSISGPGEPSLSDTAGEITATLPLFHRVDENFIRGSQPVRGGIGMLTRLGVKTVVDLRSKYDYTDDLKVAANVAGLGYEWVPMSVWNPPTDDEANRFLSLVTDVKKGPFFVFCADGLNRIGEMTAIYRVAHSKWTVEQALGEADELGFNPYYYNLRNYVWDYARKFRPAAVPRTGRRVSPLDQ
jgi:protein tyrosine/serine phosphatase